MKKSTLFFVFIFYSFFSAAQTTVSFNTNGTSSYDGSIQSWTVPACVSSITVTAIGAAGGNTINSQYLSFGGGAPPIPPDHFGGLGASLSGSLSVNPGDVLSILVGAKGSNGEFLFDGGGGGGTYLWDATTGTLLVVAGGGGGAGFGFPYLGGLAGADGQTNNSSAATLEAVDSGFSTAPGGIGGNGGADNGTGGNLDGGGGAGWLSEGDSDINAGGGGGHYPTDAIYPGYGGSSDVGYNSGLGIFAGDGGYGGGGGSGIVGGGGGGGGYNGGGTGNFIVNISGFAEGYGGAGGGSYFNNTTASTTALGSSSSDGSLIISYNVLCPLPITLTTFTAIYLEANNSVLIDWTVGMQINNKEFVIEKTLDGVYYTHIATIPGAGTTPFPKSYSTIDYNPTPGVSYYRLRQIDIDGNPTDFPPASVSIENCLNASVSIFPNPVVGNATVSYYSENNYPVTVSVTDLSGRIISTYTYTQIEHGQNNFSLNTTNLSKGTYFLNLTNNQKMYSLIFLK